MLKPYKSVIFGKDLHNKRCNIELFKIEKIGPNKCSVKVPSFMLKPIGTVFQLVHHLDRSRSHGSEQMLVDAVSGLDPDISFEEVFLVGLIGIHSVRYSLKHDLERDYGLSKKAKTEALEMIDLYIHVLESLSEPSKELFENCLRLKSQVLKHSVLPKEYKEPFEQISFERTYFAHILSRLHEVKEAYYSARRFDYSLLPQIARLSHHNLNTSHKDIEFVLHQEGLGGQSWL